MIQWYGPLYKKVAYMQPYRAHTIICAILHLFKIYLVWDKVAYDLEALYLVIHPVNVELWTRYLWDMQVKCSPTALFTGANGLGDKAGYYMYPRALSACILRLWLI